MEHGRKTGSARVLVAAAMVVVGLVVVGPSFEADSDGDGVADVTEINVLNTDPSTPDDFAETAVANR